jgi:hypothetical protein
VPARELQEAVPGTAPRKVAQKPALGCLLIQSVPLREKKGSKNSNFGITTGWRKKNE